MNIESKKITVQNNGLEPLKTSSGLKEEEKSFNQELADLKNEQEVVLGNEKLNKKEISAKASEVLKSEKGVGALGFDDTHSTNATGELSKIITQMNDSIQQTYEISSTELNLLEQDAVMSNRNVHDMENSQQLLNNDFSLNKPQEVLQELKADISFAQQQGGEAFSSLLGKGSDLNESADEMKEDLNILSTMAENLAMVNKATLKPVEEVGGVVDRVISAAELNLTKEDLSLILNMVSEKLNINEVAQKPDLKAASSISDVFLSMLSDSMKNGKAFRLNFDNDISVIIKVSREGCISANFLPGTDIAENYLRNNMANLVRRFEEEGIPYEELSHQKHKRDNEQQNKKDKKDE